MEWEDLGKDVQFIVISSVVNERIRVSRAIRKNVEEFNRRKAKNWSVIRLVSKEWKKIADSLYVFPYNAFLDSLDNLEFLTFLCGLDPRQIDLSIDGMLQILNRLNKKKVGEKGGEAYSILLNLPDKILGGFIDEHLPGKILGGLSDEYFKVLIKHLSVENVRRFTKVHKWERWRNELCAHVIHLGDEHVMNALLELSDELFEPDFRYDYPIKFSKAMKPEFLWNLHRSGKIRFRNMFWMACELDNVEIVRELLRDPNSPQQFGEPNTIDKVCRYGSVELLKLLLEDGRCIVEGGYYLGVVDRDDEAILRVYLNDPRIQTKKEDLLYYASKYGKINSVKVLLEDKNVDSANSHYSGSPMIDAAKYGQIEAFKLLLSDSRYSIFHVHPVLDIASENGEFEICKAIMDKWGNKIDEKFAKKALEIASEKGHLEICKFFVEGREFSDFGDVLSLACKNGNEELVLYYLSNPKIDPRKDKSIALQFAMQHNHYKIIQILLKDGRVDPRSNDHFGRFTEHENLEIVKLLLADPRVDPSVCDQRAIRYFRNKDIIEFLLKDERIDPSAGHNDALRGAISLGNEAIIQILLNDPRVDPSDMENAAILTAAEMGQFFTVKLLLDHPKIDSKDPKLLKAIREIANSNGYLDIIELVSGER